MKVREWAEAGGTVGTIVVFDEDNPLLDAEVIGLPCKTCGGSRNIPLRTEFAKGIPLDNVRKPCPDCADTPVWVIAPEAWEAFVCERTWPGGKLRTREEARCWYANKNGRTSGIEAWFAPVWREAEALARPLFQALLPGARVAKFVGEIYRGNPDNGNPMWVDTPLPFEHPAWPEVTLTDGDTIAILARQEEVEE